MRSFIAAAAVFFAIAAPVCAEEPVDLEQENSTIELAEAYLAAHAVFDIDAIEPFLADDAFFSDPTSKGHTRDGGAWLFDGKQAMLDGFRNFVSNFDYYRLGYNMERRYESGGYVVFVAHLTYEGRTKDGSEFSGAEPIVTVVGVRDGKVISHTAYYDYGENAVDF